MRIVKTWSHFLTRTSVSAALVASLALAPLAQANANENQDSVNLAASEKPSYVDNAGFSEEMQDVAKRRADDERHAPRWLKKIFQRKVSSYFPKNHDPNKPLPQSSLDELAKDSEQAFQAMEEDAGSESPFKNFVSQNLRPYIYSLTPAVLKSRRSKVTPEMQEQTVETMVVRRQLNFLKGFRDFPKRALNLVTGPHMKFVRPVTITMIIGAAGFYLVPDASTVLGFFLLMTFWDAFKAGPIGSFLSVASGWFLRPGQEQVRRFEARYTFQLEQRINERLDRMQPAVSEDSADPLRNDKVRISDVERDGTDIAGMSPEEQLENWEAAMGMFVITAKKFSQLLRDTHHLGRDFMMLSWTDEQLITELVEVMDSKLHILRGEVEQILSPFKTAFIMNGEFEKKTELDRRIQSYDRFNERVWLEPDMSDEDFENLRRDLNEAANQLMGLGLSHIDIQRLHDIQKDKGRAVTTLITALTMGELRTFYHAERNRNLAEPARVIYMGIKRGLGRQHKVDEYQALIQRQQRAMGLKNATPAKISVTPESEIDLNRAPAVSENADKESARSEKVECEEALAKAN